MCEEMVGECWLQSARVARKAGHHQTAFNALLNGEKTHQAELLTEKAKWLWCKVHQHTHTPHTFILHTILTIIQVITLANHNWICAIEPVYIFYNNTRLGWRSSLPANTTGIPIYPSFIIHLGGHSHGQILRWLVTANHTQTW